MHYSFYPRRWLSSCALACTLLLVPIAARAQTDQTTYNNLYSAKSGQLADKTTQMGYDLQEKDNVLNEISGYQSQVTSLQGLIANSNSDLATWSQSKQTAASALQTDQANLSDLQSQLSEASADAASLAEALQEYAFEIDDIQQSIESLDEALWQAWEYYQSTGDAEGYQEAIDEIEPLLASLEAILSIEESEEAMLQGEYGAAAGAVSGLTSAVQAAQNQVSIDNSALQTANDNYQATLTVLQNEQNQLSFYEGLLSEAQSDLTGLNLDIEDCSDIIIAQEDWITANSSYQAWLNNGAPH